jgi:hypothetical protein
VEEKRRAIAKEISKLLKASFIKEVIHTKWVANLVLVPKINTKVLRMCDMGWPDLLSKLAVMVMMMIDNLVSPMISPR